MAVARSSPFRPGPEAVPLPVRDAPPAADATFRPGGEFTVGAKDELLLVDETNRLLGPAATALTPLLHRQPPVPGTVHGEIFPDQAELGTPVCRDGEELAGSLGALRRWLRPSRYMSVCRTRPAPCWPIAGSAIGCSCYVRLPLLHPSGTATTPGPCPPAPRSSAPTRGEVCLRPWVPGTSI